MLIKYDLEEFYDFLAFLESYGWGSSTCDFDDSPGAGSKNEFPHIIWGKGPYDSTLGIQGWAGLGLWTWL